MIVALSLAALALANPAPATVATWAAGKPVTVTCNTNSFGTGSAFVGGNQIWLGQSTCDRARHGDPSALESLLHEVAHTRGVDHQPVFCAPDYWAVAHVQTTVRKFWPRHNANQAARDAAAFAGNIGC